MAQAVRPSHAAPAAPAPTRPSEQAAARPSSPWDVASWRRFAEIELVGIVLLGVAWVGVSGTPNQRHEVLWIAVGILALVITGIAQAGLLLDALSQVRARRLAVLIDTDALCDARIAPALGSSLRVAVPRGSQHHVPSCVFVVGKRDLIAATLEAHVAAGRSACSACGEQQ